MPRPLVTVVTPSYNMVRHIEETIRSVLSQDYQQIEYIVMDGGSRDGTLDILSKYGGKLRYLSQHDNGTADALARGFTMARGSILGWLSADDTYLPGAISTAVGALARNPHAAAVYGQAWWTDEAGNRLAPYPVEPFVSGRLAARCFICQPACFFQRDAYERAGGLDVTLRSAFDYDLWIRMAKVKPFVSIPEFLAMSRMHHANKTLGERKLMFLESMAVLKRHYDYVPAALTIGYACYLMDNKDQFYKPSRPSVLQCLLALGLGTRHNRVRCWREFWKEWGQEVWCGLRRRLQAIHECKTR